MGTCPCVYNMSKESVRKQKIAYFSMEVGLEAGMPTYSGGLGILAGDTIRSAADMRIPMVAVTLLYRKGYFRQCLDAVGRQTESPEEWKVEDFLKECSERVTLKLGGREVRVRAWEYPVKGITGFVVPVYFLDTDLDGNNDWERSLTHLLYGGDDRYRLCQEAVLGAGGVKMLRALGYQEIERFHMNEGHSSLLTLELLDEELQAQRRATPKPEDLDRVREKCVFTTHTPVPAGHDKFPLKLVEEIFGRRKGFDQMQEYFCCDGVLNLTYLALNLSGYVNGVAKKHGEVSRRMFSDDTIDSITNGIHTATWAAKPFQDLFDRYIPGWRQDAASLRNAFNIPNLEVWEAHMDAKQALVDYVSQKTGARLDVNHFTLGFARRAAAYKRGDLIFHDLEQLKKITAKAGRFQILFAGKAHPQDAEGKALIQRIFQAKEALRGHIAVVYLENYNMEVAKLLTSGVDLWLNNPEPPLEASGTSGMKAALNGVPSLSILDGWWIEGYIEGLTGWSIGEAARSNAGQEDWAKDAASLYLKLSEKIIPLFYQSHERFLDVMRHAIALNASFFNTQRMLQQYVVKAYFV